MTSRALVKLGMVWQERLLLQHWAITFTFNRELKSWGLNEFEAQIYKRSLISIHPDGPEGVEFYLVHELLHLHVGARETGINQLTRAFIKAYRRGRKQKGKQ